MLSLFRRFVLCLMFKKALLIFIPTHSFLTFIRCSFFIPVSCYFHSYFLSFVCHSSHFNASFRWVMWSLGLPSKGAMTAVRKPANTLLLRTHSPSTETQMCCSRLLGTLASALTCLTTPSVWVSKFICARCSTTLSIEGNRTSGNISERDSLRSTSMKTVMASEMSCNSAFGFLVFHREYLIFVVSSFQHFNA